MWTGDLQRPGTLDVDTQDRVEGRGVSRDCSRKEGHQAQEGRKEEIYIQNLNPRTPPIWTLDSRVRKRVEVGFPTAKKTSVNTGLNDIMDFASSIPVFRADFPVHRYER